MDAGKKTRQIAFRLDAEMYARYERAAAHDKLKVAALTRRLAEWALKSLARLGSLKSRASYRPQNGNPT
jgi:hypothetical protein